MPKLYFRYGTMNCSKTMNLLMVAHNYRTQGKRVLIMKPKIDSRIDINKISSRTGFNTDVDIVLDNTTDIKNIDIKGINCILVDEGQFLTEKNVDELRYLTNVIPVIVYGLKTDYRCKLFEGSKRLLELSDSIEEIKTVCIYCDQKAIINSKYIIKENKRYIVFNGSSEFDFGFEEKYQPLCWKCWNNLIKKQEDIESINI